MHFCDIIYKLSMSILSINQCKSRNVKKLFFNHTAKFLMNIKI